MKKPKTTQKGKSNRQKVDAEIKKKGSQVIDGLGFEAGPEFASRGLKYNFLGFMEEKRLWKAFDGMSTIVAAKTAGRPLGDDKFFGYPPEESIEVPWWILLSIFIGWKGFQDDESLSLGQAFEVERAGTGQRSSYENTALTDRDRYLALSVSKERRAGREGLEPSDVESAISTIATEFRTSPSTIWKAWKKFGTFAEKTISEVTLK